MEERQKKTNIQSLNFLTNTQDKESLKGDKEMKKKKKRKRRRKGRGREDK